MSLSKPIGTQGKTAWLIEAAAECLQVSPSSIDPSVPLARYGLDSFAAIQLTTQISTKLQRPVPDALLLHYQSIDALESFLQIAATTAPHEHPSLHADATPLDRMFADSILPLDIFPPPRQPSQASRRSILLTGATGFLGGYLLRALLRDTQAKIYALVRDSDANALDRIRSNLQRYGIWESHFESRLQIVLGDLRLHRAGISAQDYDFLTHEIDEIYHCGASVNWVTPYAGLREINVSGTRELLRLACVKKTKPFRFISSMAACYTTSDLADVTEHDEMLPYLKDIHLGYAQSKCVAESLVRRAHERGLPATIFRPSLISGDGHTGASNADDLLSAMIRGCVEMGAAPDLDWSLDCCSVDYAADVMVSLTCNSTAAWQIVHLINSKPQRWQDVVLWMNLYGYPVTLLPYRAWLAQLRTSASRPAHPLYRLRSFFLARSPTAGNLTLPELYEDRHRNQVSSQLSQQLLSQEALDCPPLDAPLLERYFADYIRCGALPEIPNRTTQAGDIHARPDAIFFQRVLRSYLADDSLRVASADALTDAHTESITTELASWRSARYVGLGKYQIDYSGRAGQDSIELFVKAMPRDEEVIAVAEGVAHACDAAVGQALAVHRERLGIAGSHIREIALYQQPDRRLRDHTPALVASQNHSEHPHPMLVLESISELELLDSVNGIDQWCEPHRKAAIRGLAQVHSIWYQRDADLAAYAWLSPKRQAAEMCQMNDLWVALLNYAWKYFADWLSDDIRCEIQAWIADSGQWWQELEQMPSTLIHNDFNPRNLAFRNDGTQLTVCVYDWELATTGLPQHDLAEFLCFVLTPDTACAEVHHYVEFHRKELAQATGTVIDADAWRRGFQLSLRHLMMNRFAMYTLVHTFRPQAFLPRVIRTWRHLHTLFND